MSRQSYNIKGKTVLITGATSGIGKVTAFELARMGAALVIAGRNEAKCKATVEEIARETGNTSLEYLVANLALMSEVRKLADEFTKRHEKLHILINNAGAIYYRPYETSEELELTFALNYLSPFLLTNLLLEVIERSAPARIINVSSGIHKAGKINFEDLQADDGYSAFKAYGQSKLANVMFTYELARRIEGKGVTVNAMNPGFTRSGFGLNNPGFMKTFSRLSAVIWGHSVEKGAETLIWLASSPAVQGVTGLYFEDREAVLSSRASYDQSAGRRLWKTSEELIRSRS